MPGRVVDRLQRHHHLHGRAVRVRDDALVARRAPRRSPLPPPAGRAAPCARRSSCRRPRSPSPRTAAPTRARPSPPAENSAMSNPSIAASASSESHLEPGRRRTGPCVPAERADASGTTSRAGEAAARPSPPASWSRRRRWRRRRHRDVSAADSRAGSSRCPASSRSTSSLPSSNASCSARTASDTRSAAITQEILIGEVEIISMLISCSPSVWNTLAATPGWLRMPAPTTETLPICSSAITSASPSSAVSPWSDRLATRQVRSAAR